MNRRNFLKSSAAVGLAYGVAVIVRAEDVPPLAPPVIEGRWLRPADTDAPARPLWGHAEGLRVGIVPPGGPRGLLRVYAPYLRHDEGEDRLINYIAVEPIPAGQPHRALSELEHSRLDGVRGKRFWSTSDPAGPAPLPEQRPARGKVVEVDGVEALRVYVGVERFDNGAHVFVRLTFRADRPHEVGVAAFASEDSVPLSHCVLTATMGNYARLRRLHLADGRTVLSTELWPDYRDDAFAPHAKFKLAEMWRTPEGHAVVSATPDEARPQDATYAPDTKRHWRYTGLVATQAWRSEDPHPRLEAWVNGRYTYWASRAPIPGGISFENFELVSPFRQGEEFWFGVEPGVGEESGSGEEVRP
jgi:hypothetical protein